MIEKETYLVCDVCGITFKPEDREMAMHNTPRAIRKEARGNGWTRGAGDAILIIDKCEGCKGSR